MPALLLKTSGATFSVMDREETIQKIKQIKQMFPDTLRLPKIYLIHGDLSPDEIN